MPRFLHQIVTLAAVVALLSVVTVRSAAAQQSSDDVLRPRVDSIFATFERPNSPGCAVGIYRNGAMAYARGYGLADLERRVPITPKTIFDLGSTSKQFAAATMVLLAQDGVLSLDDDVRRWIPELPDYGTPITIRHLLHHTSGLRDYIGLLTMHGKRIDDVTTPGDALAMIVRQRELNFVPGAEHLYSNSGYFLLSIIVERATGRSLRDVARERIFTPLGMTATHYLGSYDDVVPDRALAYAPRAGGWRTDMSRWLQLGDGAVFSNVEELLAWDANFYEPRVGGAPMLETLQQPGTLSDGTALRYALGLMTGEYRGQRIVGHGGSWGGYRAELVRFPEQRLSVATLCNAANANPSMLALRVADVYLGDVLAAAPPPSAGGGGGAPPAASGGAERPEIVKPSAAELAAYAGRYYSEELDVAFELSVDRDSLRVLRPGTAAPEALAPYVRDEFRRGGVSLRFMRDASGAVTGFTLGAGRVRNVRFERTGPVSR